MKKSAYLPLVVWMVVFMFIITATMLYVTGSGQAQAPSQVEDNIRFLDSQSLQDAPELDPSQANASGMEEQATSMSLPVDLANDNARPEAASAQPDLVITDPSADVQALVAEVTGMSTGHSQAIPAAAFTADGSGRLWFFGFNSSYIYPNGGTYCGIAPLYLPNGATVTAFTSYLVDNDVDYGVNSYLYAKPLGSTTGATTMASLGSVGQSTALQALVDTTITQPVIDNSAYTYHIGVCMWGSTSAQQFYSVKLDFLYNTYLPDVLK